ncbi:MAG: methyltransferase family protein, partial [Vicinamibacterales bacterium]
AARAFAWAGGALFVAALVYFLFSYTITFGEIVEGKAAPGAIVFNLVLFSAFAVHHSIFARDAVRAFVRRIVSAPLERAVYVWVASLMLIGVCYAWRPVAGVAWQIPSPWNWAMVPVQLVGVWLTLRATAVIDGLELAGVRQVLNPESLASAKASAGPNPKTQNEFKTDGPYGWVRHPIYLGWILLVFAVGTMTMTRLVFASISSVYILIAIPFEERTLRAHSAGGYDEYIRRVPWKLIPHIY